MRKVNKVIILFGVICFGLGLLGLQLIESNWFAHKVEKKIRESFLEKINAEVSFENIEFKAFPPKAVVNNLKIKNFSFGEVKLEIITVDELNCYIGIKEIFFNKIAIKELEFVRSKTKLQVSKQESNKSNTLPDLKKIFEVYRKEYIQNSKVFVRNVSFKNSDIKIPGYIDTFIKNMTITFERQGLDVDFELHNIKTKIDKKDYLINEVDYLSGEVHINGRRIEVSKALVKKNYDAVNGHGVIKFNKGKYVVDLLAQGNVNDFTFLYENISALEFMGELKANAKVDIKLFGDLLNLDTVIDAEVTDFKPDLILADSGNLRFKKDKEVISFESITLNKGAGNIKLKEPFMVYNMQTQKSDTRLKILLDNFYSEDLLYYINDITYPLKGFGTGEGFIDWKKNLTFNIQKLDLAKYKFIINDQTIFENQLISFKDFKFVYKDQGSDIDTEVYFKDSMIKVNGKFFNDRLNIFVKSKEFDFSNFGTVAGMEVKGKGEISYLFMGTYKDTNLVMSSKFKEFEVLNLKLGDVKTKSQFHIQKQIFQIFDFESSFKNAHSKMFGNIDLAKDNVSMHVDINNSNYSNLLESGKDFLPELVNILPENVQTIVESNFKVDGSITKKEFKVQGSFKTDKLVLNKEEFKSLSFNFLVDPDVKRFENVLLKKGEGRLLASVTLKEKQNFYDYSFDVNKIYLKDFYFFRFLNFGLNGEINGNLKSKGIKNSLITKGKIDLKNVKVDDKIVEDSFITINGVGDDLYFEGNLFNNEVVLESYLNLKSSKDYPSYFNAKIDLDDIQKYISVVSNYSPGKQTIFGGLKSSFESSFIIDDPNSFNLDFLIK